LTKQVIDSFNRIKLVEKLKRGVYQTDSYSDLHDCDPFKEINFCCWI